MTEPIRVLIVDDHRMFREGIRSRLEQEDNIEVVGEAASGEEALNLAAQANPTCVLLDIRMPDMSGIDLARRLRAEWPELKILVLTGYDFDQYIRAMTRIGIDGYLTKDAPQGDVVAALHEIAAGGAVLQPRIASKVMKNLSQPRAEFAHRRPNELTVRELEVLDFMHQGLRNDDIASQLSISRKTVEAHVGNIVGKLGAINRGDAVRVALEQNLIR